MGRYRVVVLVGSAAVEIGSRALDILIALVERAGEVVGKKALVARVWPEVIVEESSLRVHVAGLRRALGDGVDGARYVANVPGRGYSFVAPVSTLPPAAEQRVGVPPSPPVRPMGLAERVPTSGAAPAHAHERAAFSLPARLTRMIGRDAAVVELSQQLRARRFVTIAGPGGLGKTTVAVAVAHLLSADFSGVIFVDLTAVADATGVGNGIASTLGLTVRKEDGLLGAVEETSAAEVEALYRTNVFGLLATTRAVLPYMRRRRAGHLVNFSSVGRCAGHAGWGVYSSTLFAVEGLSEALALELQPLGIRVTVVESSGHRTALDTRSLAVSARTIDDYLGTSVATHSAADELNQTRPIDPGWLADVLIKLIDEPNPPARLLLPRGR